MRSRETFKLTSTITDIGARSDIAADGFWGGHFEKRLLMSEFLTHLPHLTPHPHPLLATANMKKEHISNASEHVSFTPTILSTTGGMGQIATTF